MLAWLVAGRVVVGICDLMLAGGMYLLFLLLQGRSPVHQLWWIPRTTLSAAFATAALVVLRAFLDVLSTRAVVGYVQGINGHFLLQLTRGYSEMRWGHFVECNGSELLNHSIHTVREAANYYHVCIELIAAAAIVVVMTAALVYQSPLAACGCGTAILLLYGIHRFLIRKQLQVAASKRESTLRMLQTNLADMFRSGKEIRTYRNQEFFHDRIDQQARSLAASNRRVALLPQVARILSDQGVVIIFLCIIIAVQMQHSDVRRWLSLLVFYFVLSRRLLPLISQVSMFAGQIEGSYKNVQIVHSELEKCLTYRAPMTATQLPGPGFVLELERVICSFDQDEPFVRDASLRLREGESVLLRGVSGSGKSSLLNIIAGVSQPSSGVVRVNRASVAYVPQDIALLDDSIRNNLLFGLTGKTTAELMHALAAARLSDFVAAQPLGLETAVGDNGILLSGGERQRLGLARAILRGATLLLLDEATSALDEENESQIRKNLANAGIAVVLATHRVHRQFCADRVLWLREGELVEQSEALWGAAQAEASQHARIDGINPQTLACVAADR
jgi:ABC-type multidrug transport system fused ATPase/permease subunit